jgi:hypothetical protein
MDIDVDTELDDGGVVRTLLLDGEVRGSDVVGKGIPEVVGMSIGSATST